MACSLQAERDGAGAMRANFVGWALMAVLLAGCTARVTPPQVEVEAGVPIRVEVGERRGGGFCPPGQRKQGNC